MKIIVKLRWAKLWETLRPALAHDQLVTRSDTAHDPNAHEEDGTMLAMGERFVVNSLLGKFLKGIMPRSASGLCFWIQDFLQISSLFLEKFKPTL